MNATTEQGAVGDTPLGRLFPDATAVEIDRIHSAAASLDQVRVVTDPARWWWHPTHAAFPGPVPAGDAVILSTSINIEEGPGD